MVFASIGDYTMRAADQLQLTGCLQCGVHRHAFNHQCFGLVCNSSANYPLLFDDVGSSWPKHRCFGTIGKYHARESVPVALAQVRMPPALSPAAISRVTDDFPRVPFTCTRIGIWYKRRRCTQFSATPAATSANAKHDTTNNVLIVLLEASAET